MKCIIASLPFDTEIDYISGGMPLLLGQLEKAGIKTRGIDFNAELYDKFFDKHYVKGVLKDIENSYRTMENETASDKFKAYNVLMKNKKYYENLINKLPQIKKHIKNKQKYQNEAAGSEFAQILKVIFAPYLKYIPSKRFSHSYNYEEIKNFASSRENNIFYNFLLKYGSKYNFRQYDFAGISMPLLDSLYYAFTLGKYIKDTCPRTKVLFGGPIITRLWDYFLKFPEIFDLFCDNIIEGDGDVSIVKYMDYIKGKITAEEIPGLLYKKDNKIVHNEAVYIDIRDTAPPSLKNIDLSKYAENVQLALQFSRGCTWNKCSFCLQSFPYSRKYSIIDASIAADTIENIVKKHKINSFHIIDDHVPLGFLLKFADEIIKRKLKIKYQMFSRFEDYYTQDIFNYIYKSGCMEIFWGFESASEHVLKLMNKGIPKTDRNEILRMAKTAGIRNQLGIIFGFPGETEEEIKMTEDFILKNFTKTFDWFQLYTLALQKNSRLLCSPEKHGIYNIKQTSDFNLDFSYDITSVSLSRAEELCKSCIKKASELKTDSSLIIQSFGGTCSTRRINEKQNVKI